MLKHLLIFLLLQAFLLPSVIGQQTLLDTQSVLKTDTAGLKPLPELVVTANRVPIERFTTAAAIDVLDTKRLNDFQVRATPEAFGNIPGVFVQKTNLGGGSPFIRGLTGNQTLLLLDGIRLNNATYRYGPNQYLNTIDVFSIGRAEILRGSGSVQYGSDAMGGTIQLFSKAADFQAVRQWSGRALGRLWSQGMEQSGRAELGYSSKRFALQGGGSYRHYGDLVGGDTTGRQAPSGYDEKALDLKMKVKTSAKTALTLAGNHVQQQHVPVFHKIRLENFAVNEFNPQKRSLYFARLDGKTNSPWLENWYLIGSVQHTVEGRSSQKNNASIRREERDAVQTLGFSSNISSRLTGFWTANSGIEMYADKVSSSRHDIDLNTGNTTAKRGLYPDGASMQSWAVFTRHEIKFRPWKLELGARYNGFKIDITDEVLGETTISPQALIWDGALMYRLDKRAVAFFSYNGGFRAPNIDDMGTLGIVDFRYELPNYSLRPERSHNIQAGFKWKSPRLKTETFVYRNELRDLIARIKTPDSIQNYPVYRKENVEKAYIQGIESQWEYHILPWLLANGHLCYTFGQNLSKQEPVRRIPPLNGRLALRFQPKAPWFATVEWMAAQAQTRLAQGDKDDNRIPLGGTPGWNIVNVFGGFERQNLQIMLALHNLFNRDYRLHGSGINAVGRSLELTLSYRFAQH